MVQGMGRLEERVYDAWVVLRRAEDVKGEWVAHCLDFDLVAQGLSMQEAAEAAKEAIGLVLTDDIEAKLNPYDRRAPQRFWTDLYDTIADSRTKSMKDVSIGEINSEEIETLICRISLRCIRGCDDGEASKATVSVPLVFERPAAGPISAQA